MGLIIGVLVGLGAALAVAVYVTRVPVPFLSKGQSRTAEQDAAESRKNKDWDPNAPLYGKNPAKPAASAAAAASSEPASAVAAAPASSPSISPASSPAGGPPARADAKPAATSADPLGDLARARTAAPAAVPAIGAAPSTLEPFVYFVQVGAFRSADEAEALRARLSLSGVETRVTEREQSGRMVHRVRVGPFERREEAERAKDKLEPTGLETALVRVQR